MLCFPSLHIASRALAEHRDRLEKEGLGGLFHCQKIETIPSPSFPGGDTPARRRP